MIKTLQKKFVVTAMIAVSVLLIALLGALNIGNAIISSRQTDALLSSLLTSEIPHSPEPLQSKPGKHRDNLFDPPLTEDSRLSARYFMVMLDTQGEILQVETSRIASVSAQEAREMAQQAYRTGKSEGLLGTFLYRSATAYGMQNPVYVFLDVSSQTYAVIRVLLLSVMIGLICWGLMLLLVILLSKKALRPIAANMERQRQFVTDAGHEIKTPLSIILANTEAMELFSGQTKWSRNIREQTVRLNGLMQDLLSLSKIDERSFDQTRTLLNASQLLEETVEMFRQSMELRNVTLTKQIVPDVTVSANQELLTRLFSILMDNASKYTSENGTVTVSLSGSGNAMHLTVQNDCDELPDCPPDKLFDRFYRADAARTQSGGGYGIGLSAAQSIAEVHNGTITAQYTGEHTIAFTVRI